MEKNPRNYSQTKPKSAHFFKRAYGLRLVSCGDMRPTAAEWAAQVSAYPGTWSDEQLDVDQNFLSDSVAAAAAEVIERKWHDMPKAGFAQYEATLDDYDQQARRAILFFRVFNL